MNLTKSKLRQIIKEELQNILNEENNRVFAPNHYCAHHVAERQTGKKGIVIDHSWNKKLQEVTRYDVDFGNNDIRTIPVKDLYILEASLAEDHKEHSAKRDDDEEESKS